MYEALKFRITGINQTIQHNAQTSDPLNAYAKALKEVTGKNKKTDEDHHKISEIELRAGLYIDDGCFGFPGANIRAMLATAGKRQKLGTHVKRGVICRGFCPLTKFRGFKQNFKSHEAATDYIVAGSVKHDFLLRKTVKLNNKSLVRTRPQFHDWALDFDLTFDSEIINKSDLVGIIHEAGTNLGLGDWAFEYGLFEAEEIK